MEEQSDTPRTDATQYRWTRTLDLARDLERELATATRERDEARAALLAIELAAASLADAQVIALEALAARADNEPNRLPSHRCSSLCSPDETFCAITKDGKCDAMDRSCDAVIRARADHEEAT